MQDGADSLTGIRAAGGLPSRIMEFSGFLRNHGFRAFSSGVIDAMKGLRHSDICCRQDFFSILRMNLTCTDLEWHLFPGLFAEFWGSAGRKEEEKRRGERSREIESEGDLAEDPSLQGEKSENSINSEKNPEKEIFEGIAYSPVATIQRKDLSRFQTGDIPVAQLLLKSMMSPFRLSASRRKRRSRGTGAVDFRRVMKKAMRTEGIPFALFFRKKKKRLKRLVFLADVSGSMDRYARFVMPFILGLRGIGSRAEVFVFSTSLSRISLIIRRSGIEKVLGIIADHVPGWSGGTRIGYSLSQLNTIYGRRHLTRRTVVVIMSDGWDLGGKNLLKSEMEDLHSRVHSVIWLNPLAGDPEYSPLSKAMESVLPYLDCLLPADSLHSLKKVGRTLMKVMAG